MKNNFLKAVFKYDTVTENGALSHSTTGSVLLDYFSKCGTYRERDWENVSADMSGMWAESPELAVKMIFYNRMVSRKIKGLVETEKVQKGQGNRSEFRKAIGWLAAYEKEVLEKNLWLVPLVGCWKDLWHEDLISDLDHHKIYALISKGLEDEYNSHLLAKYLPKIRSKSNTYNERHEDLNRFVFGLLKYLKWTPKQYRKFKANGQAHVFQKQMCAGEWEHIDFNTISGKALYNMVNHKGKDEKTILQRHDLELSYVDWVKKQPMAKFTGYVYELMKAVKNRPSLAQKITADKQFDGLIELARADNEILRENIWCALDTSGSMTAQVADTSAFDICISLGVYFSTLNEGAFKDHVIMFDNNSKVKKLSGTFSDKVNQITSGNVAWGSTNFQSVIDEIVRVKLQNPYIPVEDFPTTLIVVSDMQFNPVGGNAMTNYEAAMKKLKAVGLPKIRIVWWWVTGRGTDFPNQMDDEGLIMIGGFDGSIISLLLGEKNNDNMEINKKGEPKKTTPYEAMLKALDQEILNEIKI